jgi:hypothetical protein
MAERKDHYFYSFIIDNLYASIQQINTKLKRHRPKVKLLRSQIWLLSLTLCLDQDISGSITQLSHVLPHSKMDLTWLVILRGTNI